MFWFIWNMLKVAMFFLFPPILILMLILDLMGGKSRRIKKANKRHQNWIKWHEKEALRHQGRVAKHQSKLRLV